MITGITIENCEGIRKRAEWVARVIMRAFTWDL
jgi:hypothetical protein